MTIAGPPPPAEGEIIDRAGLARLSGLHRDTITRAVYESRRKIDAGLVLDPSDIPLPDGNAGQSPYWHPSPRLAEWVALRARTPAEAVARAVEHLARVADQVTGEQRDRLLRLLAPPAGSAHTQLDNPVGPD